MLAITDSSSSTATDLEAEPWYVWLAAILPAHCSAPFAPHHREFWEWAWAIEPGQPADEAFIGIWARGGAKSTSAEGATLALGARRKRRYGWYVSGTQDQADKHVETIADMLEAERFEMFYPEMAQRLVGKYGNSRGWRRNRLRTASGFTVDAVGLDRGARGVKVEDQRPDFIVIDDVDDTDDTPRTTRKKIDALTRKILPAGSADVIVLGIQNVVHPHSVFARLADGRAEFLARRKVSGPIPAIDGLQTVAEAHEGKIRHRITAGTARWAGQSLEVCQRQVDDWGLAAFVIEAQHDVARVEGAMWCREQIEAMRVRDGDTIGILKALSDERRGALKVVAVDPAGTSGPDADDTGIIAVARSLPHVCPVCGPVGAAHAFVLADRTCHLAPNGWAGQAITLYDELECHAVVVERNMGGEMCGNTIRNLDAGVPIEDVHADDSKHRRAMPIAGLYGSVDKPEEWSLGRVHHLGDFPELEEQMTTWRLGDDSPDRLDAFVHAMTYLELADEPRHKLRFRGAA